MFKYRKLPAMHGAGKLLTMRGDIEVTEKVDGSQIRWEMETNGGLVVCSKGARLDPYKVEKPNRGLFGPSCTHLIQLSTDCFRPGYTYFGEAVSKPKHNKTWYGRVPKGHIVLWDAFDHENGKWMAHKELVILAEEMDVECTPLLATYHSVPYLTEQIEGFYNTESFLGNTKVEGVVFKLLDQYTEFFDIQGFKLVSPAFQEKARTPQLRGDRNGDWKKYMESYNKEAVWDKAMIHAEEKGLITGEDKDIGKILREVHRDVDEEYKEDIMKVLWKIYSRDFKKHLAEGFAAYYRAQKQEEAEVSMEKMNDI